MPNLKDHLASVKYRREHLKAEIDKELLRIKTKVSEFEALIDESELTPRPEANFQWQIPFNDLGWVKSTLFVGFILDYLKKESSCYHLEQCLTQLQKLDNEAIERYYINHIN